MLDIPTFVTQHPDRIAIAVLAALVVTWLLQRSWRQWFARRPLWRRVLTLLVTTLAIAIITLIGWSVVVNGVGASLFLISWFAIIATKLMGGTVSP